MKEWGFVGDRELESLQGTQELFDVPSLRYVTLGQCQVLVSCHLRQVLLTIGSNSLRSCKDWSYCSAVVTYKEGA